MGNENLYQIVKNKICDRIFAEEYKEGDRLPPERELEELLGVSRVTVRKSLELLEEDRLIVREVGRGTKITFHNYGNKGELDMIVLVAPARNPFFSEFIGRFQSYAWKEKSLLLYVEKPETEGLEECLYHLYKRGLRNVVIWLEDLPVSREKLRRLRALGMNMVFFDSDQGLPFADCVALDNELAIKTLYDEMTRKGYKNIEYAGWDREDIYSTRMREAAYCEKAEVKEEHVHRLLWKDSEKSVDIAREILLSCGEGRLDAVICGDCESGQIMEKAMEELGIQAGIATVDELENGVEKGCVMYKQDLNAAVQRIFECLRNQCTQESGWAADMYLVEGNLIQK